MRQRLTMFSGAQAILQGNPDVDEVLNFEFFREGVVQSLKFVLGLRKRRFDVCMLGYPANRLEYNLVALLTGARIRVGHRYNHLDLVCANWLYTHAVREEDRLTNIEENLRLVELLTGRRSHDTRVEFHLPPEGRAAGDAWVVSHGLGNRVRVGFHAGGSTRKNHMHKRWPPEKFAELGRILCRECRAKILLFGGQEENEAKETIAAQIGPGAVAVHVQDVMETCAVMSTCHHFVSNDSALLHLAGAVGIPTTAIFGPTNPAWVRIPGCLRDEVALVLDCQPCFFYSPKHLSCRSGDFRCLRDLSAECVAQHVLRRLQEDAVSQPRAESAS